jgi:hypothetical protein
MVHGKSGCREAMDETHAIARLGVAGQRVQLILRERECSSVMTRCQGRAARADDETDPVGY